MKRASKGQRGTGTRTWCATRTRLGGKATLVQGHFETVTPAEAAHGHRRTYTLDTLEQDARAAGLNVLRRSGVFFKALANFQWDRLLATTIISREYLDGCFLLGQDYPDLCSSIFLVCERGGSLSG